MNEEKEEILEEDIPFKEDWVRISVENIKQSICIIQLYQSMGSML